MKARNACKFLALVFITVVFSTAAFSQTAEDHSLFGKPPEKDTPMGMKETLYKMQLEREKKDFQTMIDRGEETLALAKELQKDLDGHATLSSEDRQKIETVEKLVKKIRSELGGSDDVDDDDDDAKTPPPSDLVGGIKFLNSYAGKLVDELKKTTRFTISAGAIQSTNSILKAVRFLKIMK